MKKIHNVLNYITILLLAIFGASRDRPLVFSSPVSEVSLTAKTKIGDPLTKKEETPRSTAHGHNTTIAKKDTWQNFFMVRIAICAFVALVLYCKLFNTNQLLMQSKPLSKYPNKPDLKTTQPNNGGLLSANTRPSNGVKKCSALINFASTKVNFALKTSGQQAGRTKLATIYEKQIKESDRNPTLLDSVKNGDLDYVKHLVANGADINFQDKDKSTSLILSAKEGYIHIVKHLVKHRADIKVKDKYGYTALAYAQQNNHQDIVNYLIKEQWLRAANNGDENELKELYNKHKHLLKACQHTALLLSASNGHLDIVKYLVQQEAGFDTPNKAGNTALMLSASNGHIDVVKCLLQLKAALDTTNSKGNTALIWSAYKGYLDIVKCLVQQGADITLEGEGNKTALAWATKKSIIEYLATAQLLKETKAGNNNFASLPYLVQQGAQVNTQDNAGNTALILSASNGDLESVRYLVQQGADVNTPNKEGDTALIWSAYKGHKNIVAYLVEQDGIDTNIQNKAGDTALIVSASNGHLDIVKHLVQQGAHVNSPNKVGNTALIVSASNGHLDTVTYLVQQGAHVNIPNKEGNTALMFSAHKRNWTIVVYLVKNGADINAKDKYGETALTHTEEKRIINYLSVKQWLRAAKEGNEEMLQTLYEQYKTLLAPHKNAALLLSASNGHLAIVKHLVKQGAQVNYQNTVGGNTALIVSAFNGHLDSVKYLVQQGARVNTPNTKGNTALIWSAYHGYPEIVAYLVQKGADITLEGEKNKTALAWAEQAALEESNKTSLEKTETHSSATESKQARLEAVIKHLKPSSVTGTLWDLFGGTKEGLPSLF